jgi:hypothetical protein
MSATPEKKDIFSYTTTAHVVSHSGPIQLQIIEPVEESTKEAMNKRNSRKFKNVSFV